MDGPHVNWKFLEELIEDRKHADPNIPCLINVGSCSLHVVHGAFTTGARATEWTLDQLLRSVWYLFHDSPARREDFMEVTGSSLFPLNFCSTRWVEDVSVAERAVKIWPHVLNYVKSFEGKPKSQVSKISSFSNLRDATQDPLTITIKLQVFISVANLLQPYLKMSQTEKPMLPFMAVDLEQLLRDLMLRFIKKSVLNEATFVTKPVRINVEDSQNHLAAKHVEIGLGAKNAIRQADLIH